MSSTVISSLNTLIKINNININRHFNFKVQKSTNSAIIRATITLYEKYARYVNLIPKIGQECSIFIKTNNEISYNIFKGKIDACTNSKNSFEILASFSVIDNKKIEETFINCSTQNILQHLLPNTDFQSDNITHKQIIFKDNRWNALNKLMKSSNTVYYINKDNMPVVFSRPYRKDKSIFQIDSCVISSTMSDIEIIPISKLEIGDKVIFKNNSFSIDSISYNFTNSYRMNLGVIPCPD